MTSARRRLNDDALSDRTDTYRNTLVPRDPQHRFPPCFRELPVASKPTWPTPSFGQDRHHRNCRRFAFPKPVTRRLELPFPHGRKLPPKAFRFAPPHPSFFHSRTAMMQNLLPKPERPHNCRTPLGPSQRLSPADLNPSWQSGALIPQADKV